MSRILVLSAVPKLHVEDHGGKQRTLNLLRSLTKQHHVTVLALSWEGDDGVEKVEENLEIIYVPVESNVIRASKRDSKRFKNPNQDVMIGHFYKHIKKYILKIEELSKNADLVIIEQHPTAKFLRYVDPNVPIVYSSHNSETDLAIQMYGEEAFDTRLIKSMEQKAISSSVAMSYCSKEDLNKINSHFDHELKTYYVPNGTKIYSSAVKNFESKDVLFVGSGHPPNTEAAYKVISVARSCPEFNFIIAGSVGPSIHKNNIPDNVEITGYLSNEEIEKLFKSSFAFINPIAVGSGSHLKMKMALGHALPIITSTIGARGFDEKEIQSSMIIADTEEEMVSNLNRLKNNKVYSSISTNSLALAKKYSWENSTKEYVKMVNENIGKRKAAEPAEPSIKNKNQKEKILLYSIIRNEGQFMDGYYNKLKSMVKSFPQFEFYLSIYENDSTDKTKNKIFSKDWSFFEGVSIISENIMTKDYGSIKDADRVKNLSIARNKAIEAGGFLSFVDYILMVESDMEWDNETVRKILFFKEKEPNFDIVSGITIRNGGLYDAWATRKGPKFIPRRPVLSSDYKTKSYDKYYSTSNGLCLYRAQPFREGVRYGWINPVTKQFDCDTVVVCQNFHAKGYKNIYIIHDAEIYHEHK